MFKYKPFTIFFTITLVSLLMFLSSFLISSSIDRSFSEKENTLASVKLSGENAYAVYKYGEYTYETEIQYSSALKDGIKLPVYFDKDAPEEISLKNLTVVYILRYLSFPLLFTGLIGLCMSFQKYKKKQHT